MSPSWAQRTMRAVPLGPVVFQAALAATALSLIVQEWETPAGLDDKIWLGCVFFAGHAAWAMWSWRRLTGRMADAYLVFLAAATLFSGGHLLLYAVGAVETLLYDKFGPPTLVRTVLLVNASLACLHLGALLRVSRAPSTLGAAKRLAGASDSSHFRMLGIGFLVISLPGALSEMTKQALLASQSGYLALYQVELKTGLANWDHFLGAFLNPALLILLATAPRSKRNVVFVWSIMGTKVMLYMLIGHRAVALMSILPMLMVHDRLVKPISRFAIAGLVGLALLALPWVKAVRHEGLDSRLESLASGAEVSENPITATVREMGGTMATVAHTLELVPISRDFEHGLGFAIAATTVFPNLFWDQHPAYARGTYAQWLVRQVEPIWADSGGGLGYSMVAEFYINFGPIGGPLGLLLLGFCLAAFVSSMRRKGPNDAAVAIEAIVLSLMVFYPRGESSAAFRGLIWCALFPYLFAMATARSSNLRRAPRAPDRQPAPFS